MGWTGVVTNAGEEMISAALQGSQLTLSSVQFGKGNTSGDMKQATQLNDAVTTGTLSGSVTENGLKVRIKAGAYAGGYTLKEVGIFATQGGDPVLFALMQDSEGVPIPDSEVFPDFVLNFNSFIAVSNTENITIDVDSSAVVSESDLDEALEPIEVALENVINCERDFLSSQTSVSVDCTNDQKVTWIYAAPGTVADVSKGDIMDATYGALVLVSNGNYAVLHKGTGISITKANGKVTVTSTSAVSMATVEV